MILRTLAGGAMPTPRSTLDTILGRERWHVRGTGWIGDAIYGVNDGLGAVFGIVSGMAGYTGGSEVVLAAGLAGTLASALSMGAGAYLASKSEREVYESEVAREQAEIEEDPHEELLELELFYQLKGFSRRRGARDGRAPAEGAEAVPAHARPRGARPRPKRRSPTRWRSTMSAGVSTAIGGFIPIIPFFFTVGMPAVIASFIISTLAHFVVGASKALVTTRSWWASGTEMTHRRHPRSGDHLRPRPGVRRPLTSCPARAVYTRWTFERPACIYQPTRLQSTSTEEPLASALAISLVSGETRRRCKMLKTI